MSAEAWVDEAPLKLSSGLRGDRYVNGVSVSWLVFDELLQRFNDERCKPINERTVSIPAVQNGDGVPLWE